MSTYAIITELGLSLNWTRLSRIKCGQQENELSLFDDKQQAKRRNFIFFLIFETVN